MKIELKVPKATPGKWNVPKLEESSTTSTGTDAPKPEAAAPAADKKFGPVPPPQPEPAAPKVSAAPSYPTSSKSGPKNWDNIGDDDDDAEESNKDPDFWFKQLYAGATDEQKRAMMKSFTESNGTALSTDWADVSKRKVETKPPEGVEAKKWE